MKSLKKLFTDFLPKDFLLVLALGLIIRFILMFVTLHPDFWAISFSEYLFSFKKIFNIYDYLAKLPDASALVQNYGRNFFTYPPLAYYTLGSFGFIFKPLFNKDFFENLAVNLPGILNDGRLYQHLFLTKLPYLFFDLGILLLLSKFFDEKKERKLAVILWIFNPLVFYTSYMIGQFDIIPVFFTILSLYLIKIRKKKTAAFCLGIGGAYKMFPLFFLPFLAISEGKSFSYKIRLLLIGLFPYLTTILPFMGSSAFRQNVIFSNQSQKMLFAKINLSGAEYLSVFAVFYIFLVGLSWVKKLDLWKWFLLTMLLFFSVTHYHPQWFLWVSPFLIILWTRSPEFKFFPAAFFFCWLVITLFFEPSLSISLFAPISRSLIEVKPLNEIVNPFLDVFLVKSIIRSIFAGLVLAISAILISKNEIS